MKMYEFVGKTIEEAISASTEELNASESDLVIIEKETKQTLFSKKITITVYKKEDIMNYLREFLISVTEKMGIKIELESKIRDNYISLKMFSEKNAILIGKGGQTLVALQTIVKQMLSRKFGITLNIILDVEQYKENQSKAIESLAKRTAREVEKTKIDAKLDPMNSYQRRIVHNALNNFRSVYTVSVGEEPQRCIIIKPKED